MFDVLNTRLCAVLCEVAPVAHTTQIRIIHFTTGTLFFALRSVPMKAKIRKWFTYEKDRGMPEAILTKKSGLRRRQRAIVAAPP